MADLGTAVVAALAAVTVGYATNFLAEDFRRFRDGSALAAALAGELSSYEFAAPIIAQALETWIKAIDEGRRAELRIRGFEPPVDPVFDASVSKLGLLGPDMVESVAYVYGNIRGFRVAFYIVAKEHGSMADDELRARCVSCLDAIRRSWERGKPLVADLRKRAAESFRPWWWLR